MRHKTEERIHPELFLLLLVLFFVFFCIYVDMDTWMRHKTEERIHPKLFSLSATFFFCLFVYLNWATVPRTPPAFSFLLYSSYYGHNFQGNGWGAC